MLRLVGRVSACHGTILNSPLKEIATQKLGRSSTRQIGAVLGCSIRKAHSDVTVIGGNLVGSTAAAALGSSPAFSGRTITLIERREHRFPEDLDRWTNRVYAITPGTKE